MNGKTSARLCRLGPTITSRNPSICRHWPTRSSAISPCNGPWPRDRRGTSRVSESVLLTDSTQPAVEQAIALLDGWAFERVSSSELANAAASRPDVRVVVVTSDDPSILRAVVERAHGCGIPVVVGCADDTARRRAVELKAEEWFRCPAEPDE